MAAGGTTGKASLLARSFSPSPASEWRGEECGLVAWLLRLPSGCFLLVLLAKLVGS